MRRSFAEGCAGGSFVVESGESKGMLLMVVFKQSQIANDTNISPPHRKQTSGAEWVRMRATGSTSTRGSEVEGQTTLAETWLMEVERRMRFSVIENSMTRKDISASTFPGHLRCNSIPSCWVSMLRGVRFWASLHLLSELAAWGSTRQR